jgi:putative ABC transport system permease protein
MSGLHHTLRLLRKSPGFTITAVTILGFGIGVNTAMFSLIDAVILNVLPYPEPDRLVQIFQPNGNNSHAALVDYPDYVDFARSQHSFDHLALSNWFFLDFAGQGNPQRFTAVFATPSLFSVTNLPFVLGRPFTEEEDKHGGPLVAVLSEGLWRSRFNRDPNIIGKNLRLSGETFEVIGVCPREAEDFNTPADDVVYVPFHILEIFGNEIEHREAHWFSCFGRLKRTVSIAQAQADLELIQRNLATRYPDTRGYGVKVIALQDSMVSSYSTMVWLLGGAVACVLIVSCANVANLLFARGMTRRREIIIRATLGASRRRLIGQLLLESILLALLGGIIGLLLASCLIGVIRAVSPDYLYRFSQIKLDPAALLFVFAVTALVALLSGLLPALNLARIGSNLKGDDGRTGMTSWQRQRVQSFLVSGQVALACILLITAGLLVRSFRIMQSLPLGFNPDHLLTANITPTSAKYQISTVQVWRLLDAVLEKANRLPGVIDAAINMELPFEWTSGDLNAPFHIPGQPMAEPGKEPTFCSQDISPNYFKTMEIPLIEGRDFNAGDRLETQHVVIVDTALAQRFFPGKNPIGKQIEYLWAGSSDQKVWTIVGVVQNSRHNGPDHVVAPYQAYFPCSQRDNLYRGFLLLRTKNDPAALGAAVRRIVQEVDPDVPVTQIMTFDQLMADRSWTRELGISLVGIFSGVALLLSAVGLYGVLAYSVGQRTREIGVRLALGAQSVNILGLVISQGLRLVAIGLIIGLISTLILDRFIESILYGVSGNDPLTLGLAILILGSAGTLACLIPALAAIRINPISALRE